MSSSSREYSPDWLRSNEATEAATATSIWALTSSSSSERESEDDDDRLPISSIIKPPPQEPPPQTSVWDLASDAQPPKLTEQDTAAAAAQTPQENDDVKVLPTTDDNQPPPSSYISSSRLPLLLSDKVQRSKVLVECEGESIDLSGDLGSVGRVVISNSPSGNQDMLLDLKGTIYKSTILPSRTFCVVSFGQSEAKIEAIMNDFVQLKPQSNVYEAETMVEGTLEGFSFDSEDEGDKHPIRQTDENEGGEPQANGKSRGKSESAKKKGKTAVKKPPAKKVNKKKAPVTKKTKTKK